MTKRDKQPPIMVTVTPRGLRPTTAYDAEMLMGLGQGAECDLVPRTKRSSRQLRTYWLTLHRVVKATGRWPSAEHLHDELKLVCGFRRNVVDMETGDVAVVVDSIAFDAMPPDEFMNYMQIAMGKLSEAVGYDVLAFLEAA